MERWTRAVLCAASLSVVGCSGPQLQAAGQGWQRQQCDRLPDALDRARCLDRVSAARDAAARERDGAKGSM